MKPEVHVSMPCPICGMGETGTHNHYGGRACTSCRAFFRRSVQTNSYKVSYTTLLVTENNCQFNVDDSALFNVVLSTYYFNLNY